LEAKKPVVGTKRVSSEYEKALIKRITKKSASVPKDKKRNIKAKGKKKGKK